ncbi:MAG: amidase [Alphaproteobacteria bacterium]|nr:amidase [Alphaproteobacteria bacterium]
MADLHLLSAAEASRRIARGTLTSEKLVEDCLARIRAREGTIHAWAHLDPAASIAAAREADRSPRLSALHGLPVGVKDICDTADMPTAYGSAIFADHRPKQDAACVKRLRDLGAVVLGKTVTTEFAYFTPGPTANPHDPTRTPGGSSSGSAAAVADFMAPLAFGSQTAGSVIRPAAYCGVVGFKGTHGWFPLDGVVPLAPELDTLGFFARKAEDAVLFRAALMGETDVAVAPASPRIALVRTQLWDQAEKPAQDALEHAAATLAAKGARVRDVELPFDAAAFNADQITVMAAGAAEALAPIYARDKDRMKRIRELIEQGQKISPEARAAARARAAVARAQIAALFAGFDAILTPAAPGEAPAGLERTGDPVFNRTWTWLGVPCVSLPCGSGPNGMPLAIQFVGPHRSGAVLLALARWAEGALG